MNWNKQTPLKKCYENLSNIRKIKTLIGKIDHSNKNNKTNKMLTKNETLINGIDFYDHNNQTHNSSVVNANTNNSWI